MLNTTLFEFSFYLYILAFFAAIADLAFLKTWSRRMARGTFTLAFLLHTVALFVRWGEAGDVEVAAREAVERITLTGWDWLATYLSHPPWSNLYESLVCFAWGAALTALYFMWRHRIPLLSVLASGLVLVAMGAASLLVSQEITPLVPALQSVWLHMHVSMAIVSYPAFGIAAFLSLFYLLKENVASETIGAASAFVLVGVLLAVGGGDLWLRTQYAVPLLTQGMSKLVPTIYSAVSADGMTLAHEEELKVPLFGVGPLFWLSGILALVSLLVYATSTLRKTAIPRIFWGFLAGSTLTLLAGILMMVLSSSSSTPLPLTKEGLSSLIAAQHTGSSGQSLVSQWEIGGQAPYFVALSGNPFELALLMVSLFNLLGTFLLYMKRDWLCAQLPASERLDDLAYRTILFAFPFLTLLIITGAVWAYYAWGRYWGWDPKETWSLITWIAYSIYLHLRVTHGWEGKGPATIAVLGFGVVIFTYLGVNLLLSGLHSYGSG